MSAYHRSSQSHTNYNSQYGGASCETFSHFGIFFCQLLGCLKQSQNDSDFDRYCKPLRRVHEQVASSWQIWLYTCWARTRAAANAWLWWASCGLAACNREGEGGGKWAKKGVKQAHLGKFAHAAYSPASHAALNSRLLAATLATRPQWRRCEHKRARLSEKWTVVFCLFKVGTRGTEKCDQWGMIWKRTDSGRQIAQSYKEVDLESESGKINTVEGQSQVIKVNLWMIKIR